MLKSSSALRAIALACASGLVFAVSGCSPKPEPAAAASAAKVDWPALVTEWIESDFKANPGNAVYQGRHDFDGQIADWSEAGLAAEIQRLKDWKARVEAIDAASLDDAQKFERSYMIAVIDGNLFWRETADWPHKNPTFYGLDPAVYLERPYADLPTRMKAYTVWANNIPRAAEQIAANLKGPMPRAYIDIGMNTFGPLGEFLRDEVPGVFKEVQDPAAQAALKDANDKAAAALAKLNDHLKSLRATQTEDFAMGADLFSKMIYANERVDAPLAELEAIGRADLDRNKAALKAACDAYARGKTIPQCIAKAEASKPEGGDFVGYARKQLVDLRKFVIEKNVVTVPSDEEARVKQSPPYAAQNGAYIDPTPPFEPNTPAFYNISAPDPKWPKQKQLDYIPGKANLLFTSVHEVWPGHFLQFLHSKRSTSMFGKVYVGYAFAEGWAHYAEEMMWEMGLGNGDPEVHIGQLTNATLRNVRFLSAIGMHTGGMTLAQSKQMFITDGFQDEGTAEQQSARGAYDPAYLNYTMGKLMIRKLRADWCGARAGAEDKACWKDFHDAFLAYGGPPIPLVRGAMMKTEPKAVF